MMDLVCQDHYLAQSDPTNMAGSDIPPNTHLQQQRFSIHPWTKVPLWDLWDGAPNAKGPGRSLSTACG